MPTAEDLPSYETDRTVTPTNVNPLGVKGAGETGTIACSPAIVNAAVDALSHLGVRHMDMPLTSEKCGEPSATPGQPKRLSDGPAPPGGRAIDYQYRSALFLPHAEYGRRGLPASEPV